MQIKDFLFCILQAADLYRQQLYLVSVCQQELIFYTQECFHCGTLNEVALGVDIQPASAATGFYKGT